MASAPSSADNAGGGGARRRDAAGAEGPPTALLQEVYCEPVKTELITAQDFAQSCGPPTGDDALLLKLARGTATNSPKDEP